GDSSLNLANQIGNVQTGVNGDPASVQPHPTNNPGDPNVDGIVSVVGPTARLFFPNVNTAAGSSFTTHVNLQAVTGFNLTSADFALSFDAAVLQVTSVGSDVAGFSVTPNIDNAAGTLRVSFFTGTTGHLLSAGETIPLINITFSV